MKFLMMMASLILPEAVPAATPNMAMSTKCRKVEISLHPKPEVDELNLMLEKVVPTVPKTLKTECENHLYEMRALIKNGSWEELTMADKQKAMGDLLNDCCERKK
jgi:hypothetical protein